MDVILQSFDTSINFVRGEDPGIVLRNFWAPEDGFVWSNGKWSEITFPFNPGHKPVGPLADLIIEMDVYKKPDRLVEQSVLLYLNGLRIGSYTVQRRTTYFASFDPKILRTSDNVLTLDTPDSASPADFGSTDTRTLGVQLFSVQIRRSS